jgi:hypothetical protein
MTITDGSRGRYNDQWLYIRESPSTVRPLGSIVGRFGLYLIPLPAVCRAILEGGLGNDHCSEIVVRFEYSELRNVILSQLQGSPTLIETDICDVLQGEVDAFLFFSLSLFIIDAVALNERSDTREIVFSV